VEIVRDDMSVTSVLDTKEDDTSAFCTTSEKLREDDMSVTITKQHETLLHQHPQKQAIVWIPRNEQGGGLPAGFNHQPGDVSKFSIGHRTLEWTKKSLNSDPCQHYNFEGMKRAYNQRMLATHPDKNMNASEADREQFGEEFRDSHVAWNILRRDNVINKIKRPTITTPCDTQYANDLKKNLERFVTLGPFLKELKRLHGLSYPLADQTKKLEAHLAEQRKNLQAHLAEVESDRTTRVAFIMQSSFEKESGVLLFRGEEDQAEMTALINKAEMPALLNAKSTTTQKHKVDSTRSIPSRCGTSFHFVCI
jgi:hypothetical protein